MNQLRRVLISTAILLILAASSFAEAELPIVIPENLVNISVSGQVSIGSQINLDFRCYWASVSEATGREVLSVWVTLPDQGEPIARTIAKMEDGESVPFDQCASIGKPLVMRGMRIAPLSIHPVIQEGEILEKLFEISVQIETRGVCAVEVTGGRRSQVFDEIIHSLVVNPPPVESTDEYEQEHLLVICPDEFIGPITPFVEWKRRKGLECTLTKLSDIGANVTDQILKNYIQTAYYTWTNPPDFVLFAGDETEIPVHYAFTTDPTTIFSYGSYGSGYYLDDNFFACLEGGADDYFPDILLGRWVVNTEYEYAYMGAKVIGYEMTPNLAQTDWYQKATVLSQRPDYPFQSSPSQRETKLYIREMLLQNGFTSVDTLFNEFYPNYILEWINEGRSFINYRGSGWYQGWSGVSFYFDSLWLLANSRKLPVVTGIGCGAAKFDEADDWCFGEVWMLEGTMTNHRGSIAFIGPTHNTHTVYNDTLDIGIYASIFDDSTERICAALNLGKMKMYDAFEPYFSVDVNVDTIVHVAFNQYCYLSDPELKPYTNVPLQLQADYPSSLPLGSMTLEITVYDDMGQPFEGALVALYLPGDFHDEDLTGTDGTVELDWNASVEPAYVYITATAYNYAPVADSILVTEDMQYVVHQTVEIDDAIGGNGDGYISPGESLLWIETLKNWGTVTSPDVHATLSSTYPNLAISIDSANFGDIAPGESAVGIPEYALTVPPEPYQAGDTLCFQLHIQDALDSSWTSYVNIPLATPIFSLVYVIPNFWTTGVLERGDSAYVLYWLENIGVVDITDGTLELTSPEPFIEIIGGSVHIGELEAGSSITIFECDSFFVSTSSYAPPNYPTQFTMKLTSNEATYFYEDFVTFYLTTDYYRATDPLFDSLYTYFAYESQDTIYAECPEFEWFELDPDSGGPGYVLDFSNLVQTLTVDLPFTFRYWDQDFDRLTISADGWVMPGETTTIVPENQHLPCLDNVPGMIAVLWDDLWNTTEETGKICTYYNQANGKFYVEWNGIADETIPVITETFQVVFCDPAVFPTFSGNGEFLFYYRDLHQFAIQNCTSGIERFDELMAIENSFGAQHPVNSHGLSDSLAIRWTPDPPPGWISTVPPILEPGNCQPPVPAEFILNEPYPNPFNPRTILSFALPTTAFVELSVFNIHGQKVAELYKGDLRVGWHRFEFDGSQFSSGIYFAALKYQNNLQIRKLLLIK